MRSTRVLNEMEEEVEEEVEEVLVLGVGIIPPHSGIVREKKSLNGRFNTAFCE